MPAATAIANFRFDFVVSLFDWHSVVIWFQVRLISTTAATNMNALMRSTAASAAIERSHFETV